MPDNKIRLNQINNAELSGYIIDVGKPGPSGTDGSIQFASGDGSNLYVGGANGLFYDHTGDNLAIGVGLLPQYKLHVSGDLAGNNFTINQTGIFTATGSASVDNYIYIDDVNDNLIIRKSNSTGNCFVFDGDVGNYGIGVPVDHIPAYELDVSGDQGIRSLSSLSESKGQIEHEAGGTNLVLYNLSGTAKAKISPHEDSYILGGGLTVGKDAITSYSSTYDGLNVVGNNYVSGDVKLDGTGYLTKDLNVGVNASVSGNLNTVGTSHVDGASTFNSTVSAAGAATLSGTLDVGGSGFVSGGFIAQSPHVPPSTGSHGVSGQIAFDTGYLYLCIDTDHWTRVQLQTGDWT